MYKIVRNSAPLTHYLDLGTTVRFLGFFAVVEHKGVKLYVAKVEGTCEGKLVTQMVLFKDLEVIK